MAMIRCPNPECYIKFEPETNQTKCFYCGVVLFGEGKGELKKRGKLEVRIENRHYSRRLAMRFLPSDEFLFWKKREHPPPVELLESGDEKTIRECLRGFSEKKLFFSYERNLIEPTLSLESRTVEKEFKIDFHTYGSNIISIAASAARLPPERIISYELNDVIIEIATANIHKIFKLIPTLKILYYSVYIPKIHQFKGHRYMACIFSTIIDIETYNDLVIENLESENFLANFPLRFKHNRKLGPEDIVPYEQPTSGKTHGELIDLNSIDPLAFEKLIVSLLNKMGLAARTTEITSDGGIDIVAFSEEPITGGKYIIQCKRQKSNVAVSYVRDLYGAVNHERANKGIFIITSDYSAQCWKFAEGKPLELINKLRLIQLLERYGFKIKGR